jgi:hypothetical protein
MPCRRRDALDERDWRSDVHLLEEQHRLLVGVVSRTISGAAAHDAYHAGQIRNARSDDRRHRWLVEVRLRSLPF